MRNYSGEIISFKALSLLWMELKLLSNIISVNNVSRSVEIVFFQFIKSLDPRLLVI